MVVVGALELERDLRQYHGFGGSRNSIITSLLFLSLRNESSSRLSVSFSRDATGCINMIFVGMKP